MLGAKKACFYQLKYSLNFHNIYSKRIYYYLKSFENSNGNSTGWRIDNLNELRYKLECPKSYNVYYEFKRMVLNPAYEEINGSSDISFEYEETKIKGKVVSLKFYIKANKLNKKGTKFIDEVCATTDDKYIYEEEKYSAKFINKVQAIFKESVTGLEAKKLLDTAKGDIHIIKEKYEIAKVTSGIKGLMGWMLDAIKGDYQPPKGKKKVGSFNDYEQRAYDFDILEKRLLGWDNNEKDETGEEY